MNVAKYLKMSEDEKKLYFEQEENKEVKEYPFNANDANSSMSKLFDGEPVNKNPLTDIPQAEMRIYCIRDFSFDTEEELVDFSKREDISLDESYTLDYFRNMANRNDVIRKTKKDGTFTFYVAIEENGYGVYNYERSIYKGEFCWEFDYGDIALMYRQFRNRGIIFENDVYGQIEEEQEQILKFSDSLSKNREKSVI